jgi:gliding motility-associated-like protein
VKEWRKSTDGNYQLIGYVLRDMQVLVGSCPGNDPPIIYVPSDTCVEAGAMIEKTLRVTDPNTGNQVTFEGGGAPFSGPAPVASISTTVGIITNSTTGYTSKFTWQTSCEHLRRQQYQVTFKALDNGVPIKLPAFNSFNIRVVPPAVKNVTAVPIGSDIKVTWNGATCNPKLNPLSGYRVYRKNDCTTLTPTPCQTGAPAGGYLLAGTTGSAETSFIDNNNGNGLVVGQNYSYLVIAYYYDGAESLVSAAVCTQLKRDVPVVLNVDVDSTAAIAGRVWVRWSRPLKTKGNLDTVALPGPYKFVLKHKTAGGYTSIFTTEKPFVYQLDTSFMHSGINTLSEQHEYQLDFMSGTVSIGSSQRATSVFLETVPNDRRMDLKWKMHTPWNNYRYRVYRKDPGATVFNEIAVTTNTSYSDTDHVVNRHAYCYHVSSEGEYSDPAIFKPLVNRSQIVCDTATDLTPPCSPSLSLEADCPSGYVKVSWNDLRIRKCGDDVVKYVLHYKPTLDEQYSVVYSGTSLTFLYDGVLVSGCYAVQAVDSSGNLSPLSQDHCLDNCPEFELPNLFTPNDDNVNDFFHAIKVRQVKEIDLTIVDRWGNLVYHTRDPYFKWDGKSIETKTLVSEGTFFYVCDVYEPRLVGIIRRTLKGYLQVAR